MFLMNACYFDNREELYQNLNQPCDLSGLGYQTNVKPIISASCGFSGCHDPNTKAGGVDLNDFQQISTSGKSGVLVNRLKGIGGSQMPLSASPLTDCQIQIIEEWVAAGALNN